MVLHALRNFYRRDDNYLMEYALNERLILLVEALVEDTGSLQILNNTVRIPDESPRLDMQEILFLSSKILVKYLDEIPEPRYTSCCWK